MTTTKKQSVKQTGETKNAVKGGATKNQLPEGVTGEPRNEEEMHLKYINKWPSAVKTYLQVSDDDGKVLGSKILERKIKQFCKDYSGPEVDKIKNYEGVLAEGKDLATKYTLQINMVESGLSGTITKYRIRQGMVCNIMKNLVNLMKGPKWTEWFKTNFDPREFRSVQDYMRLGKTPGIIRYAVFGKERLLQILRQLNDNDWKERLNENGKKEIDPIGTFIGRNGINFNPGEELDAQELRIETDIAINCQKLQNAGIIGIQKDMIDALVRNGREIETVHIQELKIAKDDVVKRFEEILASDKKLEPLMTPVRKSEGFIKTTDRFIKAMDDAIADEEYRIEIDTELVTKLTEKLGQLIQLIPEV